VRGVRGERRRMEKGGERGEEREERKGKERKRKRDQCILIACVKDMTYWFRHLRPSDCEWRVVRQTQISKISDLSFSMRYTFPPLPSLFLPPFSL
jgi:hypothetical protein